MCRYSTKQCILALRKEALKETLGLIDSASGGALE